MYYVRIEPREPDFYKLFIIHDDGTKIKVVNIMPRNIRTALDLYSSKENNKWFLYIKEKEDKEYSKTEIDEFMIHNISYKYTFFYPIDFMKFSSVSFNQEAKNYIAEQNTSVPDDVDPFEEDYPETQGSTLKSFKEKILDFTYKKLENGLQEDSENNRYLLNQTFVTKPITFTNKND